MSVRTRELYRKPESQLIRYAHNDPIAYSEILKIPEAI